MEVLGQGPSSSPDTCICLGVLQGSTSLASEPATAKEPGTSRIGQVEEEWPPRSVGDYKTYLIT